MQNEESSKISNTFWFVGASYGSGSDDQTKRFVEEGIWQNGYDDKYLDVVNSIAVGDSIAIKSSYVRKHNLPFDNRGHYVSVMAIKAVGVVTENCGDGRHLKVKWSAFESPKEWYFYTNRSTIWKVTNNDWCNEALIDFSFNEVSQDLDRFRNAPYWSERFGDQAEEELKFKWTQFYEAVADKLLEHKEDRSKLTSFINNLSNQLNLSFINNKKLNDICPFTVIGVFNRGITNKNRIKIAQAIADFLGVNEAVPLSVEGIPILNNQKSWFFGDEDVRKDTDIDNLWNMLAVAIDYSNSKDDMLLEEFKTTYDTVSNQYGVAWNLTMALYWIRPWNYLPLDNQSRQYIKDKLNIPLGENGVKNRCSSSDYMKLIDDLEIRFQEDNYAIHSFPELSLAAYQYKPMSKDTSKITWKTSILNKIRILCREKTSDVFERQEFFSRFENDLQLEFPNNNSHGPSYEIQIEKLINEDILERIKPGQYRLLEDISSSDELLEELSTPFQSLKNYTVSDIVKDGCFIEQNKLEQIIERLRTKKNLILQGPPGTGKTWLAKRLGFALMGQHDPNKLRAVQFHPNLSYEDFIRGWRPSGDGKLSLVDGPFIELVHEAIKNPESSYVLVIEEINRGNPAQIFGEMLTLLEADKRTSSEALELSYKKSSDEGIYIPSNLYVIGTMNIADRSLALVDLALRRRFAFINLEPTLGKIWLDWVSHKCDIDRGILSEIEKRITSLNNKIAEDKALGPQFKVGHSYVTPNTKIKDAREWFKQVVETEIGPLLEEYWFDDLEKATKTKELLIESF